MRYNHRVYQLDCKCNEKYIEEAKKKIDTQHRASTRHHKGGPEYTKDCHEQFNWLNSKTLAISPSMYDRKIRKALEVIKLRRLKGKR